MREIKLKDGDEMEGKKQYSKKILIKDISLTNFYFTF